MPSNGPKTKLHKDFYNTNWFTRGCNLATRISGKDRGRSKKKYDDKREIEFKKAKESFERSKTGFARVKKRYQKNEERFLDEENRFILAQDRYTQAKLKYDKHGLNFSLKYLRYNIEPSQVQLFANFVLSTSYFFFMIIDILIILAAFLFFNGLSHSNPYLDGFVSALTIMIVVTILFPPIIGYFIHSYPLNRARRLQMKTIGRLPETINYMSMSMYLNPSINTAIDFASENVDEPLATDLKKVLWNVYTREFDSIEESFLNFAHFYGEFSASFERALYSIRNAAFEKTKQSIHRPLDTANDIILEGTKRQMEWFALSLVSPTVMLFSLGIMLPMIIGTMLPLMGAGRNEQVYIIIIMDVVFPLVTLLFSYYILGKRPGTSTPPDIPCPLSKRKSTVIIGSSVLIFVTGIVLGILGMRSSIRSEGDSFSSTLVPLPIIWGIGLAVINYTYHTSKHQKIRRNIILKTEEGFPEALHQMGSNIAEGKPFEESLRSIGRNMEGTQIGTLFRHMFHNIQVVRSSLKDALFGPMGTLHDLPSRTIKATMRTVIESIKKDAYTAGTTIIKISRYLRDIKSVEKEIDKNLSGVRSMMLNTGTIFGPLILGITIRLYMMLSTNMTDMGSEDLGAMCFISGGTSQPIRPEIFSLMIGIYVVFTSIIIIYFCTGIRHGDDRVELKAAMARTLPVTLTIFTVTVVLANLFQS